MPDDKQAKKKWKVDGMAIQVNVGGINDVPEIMREFVSENNGVFASDDEKAFFSQFCSEKSE